MKHQIVSSVQLKLLLQKLDHHLVKAVVEAQDLIVDPHYVPA